MYKLAKIAGMVGLQSNHLEDNLHKKFAAHVAKYSLHFGTKEEYKFRFHVYAKKDQAIQDIAKLEPNATYVLDHNRFSTLTDDEFSNQLGKQSGKQPKPELLMKQPVQSPDDLAPIDWRTLGAVNAVQNQGSCGSCWAFSSAAALEGSYFVKHQHLYKLSEQQMVDCDDISLGCNGGLEVFAFVYAKKHPIEEEKDYPYVEKQESCTADESKGVVSSETWVELYPGVESELLEALKEKPTCVSVAAGNSYFQLYTSGILNTANCTARLDHAVTAVGWGVDGEQKYLIVRNSWGADWGEDGYIKIALDGDGRGVCGILLDSTTVNVV